jgi:hypothetical protein
MARRSDSNFAKSLEHAILQNFVLSRRQRIDSESHICSRHTNKIVPTGNKFVAEFQMQVGNVPGERIRVQVVRMEDGVAITASNMGRDGPPSSVAFAVGQRTAQDWPAAFTPHTKNAAGGQVDGRFVVRPGRPSPVKWLPAINRELTLAAVECSLASRFAADRCIPIGNLVKIVRRVAARTVKNVERLGN